MPERHFDVFVSTSFSSKVDYEMGKVDAAYRNYVEGVLQSLRDLNLTVFCAVEYEEWKIGNDPSEVGVDLDLNMLDASDNVLVLLNDTKSDGNSYESGYAFAKGKAVYFMLEPGTEKLSYWNQGLVKSGRVKLISRVEDLLEK